MYRLATKFLQAPFSRVAKLNRCSLRSSAKYTSVTRNYAEANRGASVKLQIRTMRSDSWKAGDQHQLMDSDYCILVDLQDNVIGSETKRKTHIFQNGRPAPLHRAFSVFHFDDQGRLLLQQRAGSKITFPLCWTNTCCSHPLHFDHETYSETDTPADVASGLVPGAKRAAVRKLQHELGITCSKEVMDSMRFLTRLYYCAPQPADKDGVVWGEHEMDYILFSRGHVDIKADPDEVGDYRWVTKQELLDAMADPKLIWSPWFRIIVENFLIPKWWDDLDAVFEDTKFQDFGSIHKVMDYAGEAVPN